MKFLADAMLGKLAKWLRVLGYDTHYQSQYKPASMNKLIEEGRLLLTRHIEKASLYENAVLLHGNNVSDQMKELKEKIILESDESNWFSRCLICNALLQDARPEEAQQSVPEYVFYENLKVIRYCSSCGRYYWPGSHRNRMMERLKEWGFFE